MKYLLLIFVMIAITGCASAAASQLEIPEVEGDQVGQAPKGIPTRQPTVILEDFGPAPEFINEVWLNADQPLRLADLRGQVVLLEMWTFG